MADDKKPSANSTLERSYADCAVEIRATATAASCESAASERRSTADHS